MRDGLQVERRLGGDAGQRRARASEARGRGRIERPGSAAPCRAPSRPGAPRIRRGRPRDGRADRRPRCGSMRRLRRAGAPPRKAWLVTANETGSSGARVHFTAPSASLATADRCQPFGAWRYSCRFSASATIMSITPRSQALTASGGGSLDGKTERAAARRPMRASTPARALSNWAVVSTGAAPAAAPTLGRLSLLQLLAGAKSELVQLQRGAAARVGKDLGGPGERRLAVERRTPDAPQARVARQLARLAQAVLAPLLHRRLDERRPAIAEPLGQRRPGLGQDLADAGGVALQRQLLEPVELFPGQSQHRRISAPAPSAVGCRWRARPVPSTARSTRRSAGMTIVWPRPNTSSSWPASSVGSTRSQHLGVVPAPVVGGRRRAVITSPIVRQCSRTGSSGRVEMLSTPQPG